MTSQEAIDKGFIPYPCNFPAIKFVAECQTVDCEQCKQEVQIQLNS